MHASACQLTKYNLRVAMFSTQDSAPTFDPMLGFPNGRVPRVLNVSQVGVGHSVRLRLRVILSVSQTFAARVLKSTIYQEEMEAVQLSPGQKNFCADLEVKAKVGKLFC